MADIIGRVTSTQSPTQPWSLITPTAMPDTSSRNTPALKGISPTDWTLHLVSGLASGIATTPTSLGGLENLPIPIPAPEARATIRNQLRLQATERNHRHRQWQLQPEPLSTPQSVVCGNASNHRFGHSNMTRLVFAMVRLMDLYIWNRLPFINASDLEMGSYTTKRPVNALAEAPHWQILEKYWNAAMQQNNIWLIVFETCT